MVKDLLKPGGYIAGSVPNRESMFLIDLHQKIKKKDYPPNHFLRFSKISLINCLTYINFNDISVFNLDFFER